MKQEKKAICWKSNRSYKFRQYVFYSSTIQCLSHACELNNFLLKEEYKKN